MTNSPQLRKSGLAPLEPPATAAGCAEDEFFAFPLSPAQERMWHASSQRPGDSSYNGSFRWLLDGALDPQVLERAFNEILRRHEALRATFPVLNGGPVQLIAPATELRISSIDLRSMAAAARDQELDRLSIAEARHGFDLSAVPLVRVTLVQMEDKKNVLMLTLHQLISDGWSIGLIMEELQKIYGALVEGRPSPLPALSVQYPDYVVWQRGQSSGEESARYLAYWKKKLAGYRRLEVPTDSPRAAEATTNSGIVSMLLPRELTNALKEFSNRHDGTVFITGLAICAVLLRQYTGESDLPIGSPLAGRNRTDLESVIGQFVNHIVLRIDASGDPTFTDFAARVRETTWEAFANQEVPFEEVLMAMPSSGTPVPDPLYRVNFICQREYGRASTFVFDFSGIRMSTMPSKSQGALYDLNFFMVEREAGWRLSLEYNSDLFREATAQQMLDRFRQLMEAVAANSDRKLSELPQFAGSAVPAAVAAPVPAETVVAAKNVGQEREMSPAREAEIYAMPASSSQQRFWLLEKLAPENRAFNMPACVRLTGPLSPTVLENAFAYVQSRHETLRTTFEEIKGELMQIITNASGYSLPLTSLEHVAAANREAQAQEMVRKEAGEQFDLVRGPLWRARLFRLHAQTHLLSITIHHILADGWSHGILQNELWAAYQAISQESPPALAPLPIQYSDFATWQRDWLQTPEAREHLDFWTRQLTPPLPLLEFPSDRAPQNRPASHGAIETTLLPDDLTVALKNMGKTYEVTMFTLLLTCFGVLLSRYTDAEDLLIGSPVANRRAETERLIGPFSGPICLRLNLTDNPTLQELLHRVRDVTMDALSHTDLPFEVLVEKVKARASHGRSPLFQFYFLYQTAFLQPREVSGLTITPMPTFSLGTPFELQLSLIERSEGVRAQLEYNPDMYDEDRIKSILGYLMVLVRELLANPEKRLKDLPEPARKDSAPQKWSTLELQEEFVPPQDSVELQLALIWERLFERPGIGIRSNFFELGGQSLLAARLISEVDKTFHRKIDLSILLTAPTIEQLAGHLRKSESDFSSVVPIQPSGSKTPLFCVHGGGGHVLRFRAMAARLDPDQPFYGLRSPEADGALTKVTVEELAARYISDIRTVQSHGPYNISGASFGGLVAYEIATQLADRGEEIGVLALFDTGNPAYYRDLPFTRSVRFRASYLLERFQRYGKRLFFKGEVVRSFRDAAESLRIRASYRVWNIAQKVYRMRHRPLPAALRDNVKMFNAVAQAYTPRPYGGRMILFRAAGRTAEYGSDPALGWDTVVGGKIDIRIVPGDHMTILEEPYVWNLVEQLSSCLDETPLQAG